MNGPSETGNPLFDIWMTAQRQIFDTLAAATPGAAAAAQGEGASEAVWRAAADWRSAQNLVLDWARAAAASEEGAEERLASLLDPSRFLFTGDEEADNALQRLLGVIEATRFGAVDSNVLAASEEWRRLSEAGAEYRTLAVAAWSRAFEEFTKEFASDVDSTSWTLAAATELWRAVADPERASFQADDALKAAQEKLLSAGADYQRKAQDMAEMWSAIHAIPTRTEIDELKSTVEALRREVEALKRGAAPADGG